jgi:hypothetical protein
VPGRSEISKGFGGCCSQAVLSQVKNGWLAEAGLPNKKQRNRADLPSNLPGLNTPLSRLKRTPKHGGKEKGW